MISDTENHKRLNAFFTDEYHSLKAYVNSRIDDAADRDAEDVIQDVALKIFSRPQDALPITNIAGFVYNSIRNKIIDVMRTKKERLDVDLELENLWTDFAELFYAKSANEYPEHLKAKLKWAVLDLKPHYRDIILAIDFEGYTYSEITEQTGIPSGTLMSRRHRAMSLLSNILGASLPDGKAGPRGIKKEET
ncbi:MAG: RNA polymerase sigma factor [Flavobacteriaceae bacterium]